MCARSLNVPFAKIFYECKTDTHWKSFFEDSKKIAFRPENSPLDANMERLLQSLFGSSRTREIISSKELFFTDKEQEILSLINVKEVNEEFENMSNKCLFSNMTSSFDILTQDVVPVENNSNSYSGSLISLTT